MGMSETGLYHVRECIPNQDCILTGKRGRYRVIVLADGVSTCSSSGEGARIACARTRDFLLSDAERIFGYGEGTISEYITGLVYRDICEAAKREGAAPEDYSSTLSAVLYDTRSKKAVIFHLGDGLIILAGERGCEAAALPCNRMYGTPVTTTEGARTIAMAAKRDLPQGRYILICSDGAWEHMYRRGMLKDEVLNYIINGEFDLLDDMIRGSYPEDDHSYVAMEL